MSSNSVIEQFSKAATILTALTMSEFILTCTVAGASMSRYVTMTHCHVGNTEEGTGMNIDERMSIGALKAGKLLALANHFDTISEQQASNEAGWQSEHMKAYARGLAAAYSDCAEAIRQEIINKPDHALHALIAEETAIEAALNAPPKLATSIAGAHSDAIWAAHLDGDLLDEPMAIMQASGMDEGAITRHPSNGTYTDFGPLGMDEARINLDIALGGSL